MGGGVQDHLFGIVVGHVYYFFEDIETRKKAPKLDETWSKVACDMA